MFPSASLFFIIMFNIVSCVCFCFLLISSVLYYFLCFHTNNTFLFFLSFQKKKDHSTVYEPKVNRIHSTGLSIKTFVCPVIRTLGSTVCVRRSQRFLFLSPSTDEAKKNTPSITPHDTLTHTPLHRSTVTRGRIFRKDFRRRKNSNNRAARCRKSERRRQPSLHLISGDERRGGNKSFQGETSTTNPRLCAQFFFFRVHRRMTEIKYARNEHIPSGS